MNWKNITRDRLEDHRKKINAQDNILERISYLDCRLKDTRISHIRDTPTNHDSSQYENNLINSLVEKQELRETYQRNKQDIKQISDAINALEGKEKQVAEKLYITGLGLRTIACELAMDESTIYRIRGNILKEVTLYLYGREMN